MKALRREAGKVRDIDVQSTLLKTLCKPARLPQTAANRDSCSHLLELLKAKRDRHLESLCDLVSESAPLLEAKLPALAEQATRKLAQSVTQGATGAREAHSYAELARTRFLRWTRSIPEDPERLHRLRIKTKKLRYSLEPQAEFDESAELAAKLKQVQDAIGSWHDWATLEQLAAREMESDRDSYAVSSAGQPMLSALRKRTAEEYSKARRVALNVRTWVVTGKPTSKPTGKPASKAAAGNLKTKP